jgi:dethiobiotin synthetase
MKGYFVTGTDTGVGKTFVTAALARRARAAFASGSGRRVFAFKPIETGCTELGADQAELVSAAGDWQRGPLRGVYQFEQPAAPLVAASTAGREIDLGLVVEIFVRGTEEASLVLVEGAGGWRVPITDAVDMGGLAKRLGLPVLIVARAGLGTINHTLLTIEAVERDGLSVAGVVLSCLPTDDQAFAASNREQIGRRWSGPLAVLKTDPAVLDPFLQRST